MSINLVVADNGAIAAPSDADGQIVDLWLHGRSPHTQRAYRADVARFRAAIEKPLAQVTLGDLQAFADGLAELAPTSQSRILSAVKSLLAFGHRLGFLPVDAGAALKLPSVKNTLAQRILPEADVQQLIAGEPNRRNRVLLRLLYGAGLRVSELCDLTWRDVQERSAATSSPEGGGHPLGPPTFGETTGQLTVYGKGGKTRVVLLSATTWRELISLRENAGVDQPLFRSRKQGGHLDPAQVRKIVGAAARRVGIAAQVSPHWLRHAHASHALDRGCPIHLVQATLGHASVATTGRYLHARPTDSSARYLAV